MPSANPKLAIETVWLPKQGHSDAEYEDAFAVTEPTLPFRAAVADGATESAFSGGWARLLADGYVAQSLSAEVLVHTIRRARNAWSPPPDSRWYVRAKTAEGAHAAVLGLQIDRRGWRAEAVGDCCVFHVRNGRLLESWPIQAASAFSHRPALASSRETDALPEIHSTSGAWQPGDTFLLASDALSAWLLDHDAFPDLHDLEQIVARARTSGMRSDDVTALSIAIRG